jgi:hypothetical protein
MREIVDDGTVNTVAVAVPMQTIADPNPIAWLY